MYMVHHADKPELYNGLQKILKLIWVWPYGKMYWLFAAVAYGYSSSSHEVATLLNRWPKCRRRCRRSSSQNQKKINRLRGKQWVKLKLATILALSVIEPQRVLVTGCWLFAFLWRCSLALHFSSLTSLGSTEILGTPQIARAIHPFTGILMFFNFHLLSVICTGITIFEKNDIRWAKGVVGKCLKGMNAVADNGKYNLGQEMLFGH